MTRIEQIPALPPRPKDGHKGLFGRVMVVGGSANFIGAPVLAATAALRMGSGLVQIAVAKEILSTCLTITPELIGLGLSVKIPAEEIDKSNAIVVGPGLGQSLRARHWVSELIRVEKPMVIDADALNILAAQRRWPGFKAKAVLTPHPGEMKRLSPINAIPTDDNARTKWAATYAKERKVVVVLKGGRTIVTDGNRVFINTTGDSSLSKGGSGDVLSGILGCLLGQKLERFDAACLAVHIHGRAGELAGQKLGRRSVLSRDVIDALPAAIAELGG